MTIPGKVTISRISHSHQRPDGSFATVRVAIIDEGSGIEFVSAELSLADFALAVTGFGRAEATLELRGMDKVGMLAEYKTELIEYTGGRLRADMTVDPAAAEAVRPYEVDGWKGRWTDLLNGHHRVVGNTFRVNFERYVPRPEASE